MKKRYIMGLKIVGIIITLGIVVKIITSIASGINAAKEANIEKLEAEHTEEVARSVSSVSNDIQTKDESTVIVPEKSNSSEELTKNESEKATVKTMQKKAIQPIKLNSLEYIQKGDFVQTQGTERANQEYDFAGNHYDKSSVICPVEKAFCATQDDSETEVTYFINGKYKSLNGFVYRPITSTKIYEMDSYSPSYAGESALEIYGDNTLLFQATNISEADPGPVEVAIDLSNIQILKVRIIGLGWCDGGTLNYREASICFGNAMLTPV